MLPADERTFVSRRARDYINAAVRLAFDVIREDGGRSILDLGALRDRIDAIDLPPAVDRNFLFVLFLARVYDELRIEGDDPAIEIDFARRRIWIDLGSYTLDSGDLDDLLDTWHRWTGHEHMLLV